jgi:hypothetical protein
MGGGGSSATLVAGSPALGASLEGFVTVVLEALEKAYGLVIVSRAFAYMSVSRCGLNVTELEDVLSLDTDAVQAVFMSSVVKERELRVRQRVAAQHAAAMQALPGIGSSTGGGDNPSGHSGAGKGNANKSGGAHVSNSSGGGGASGDKNTDINNGAAGSHGGSNATGAAKNGGGAKSDVADRARPPPAQGGGGAGSTANPHRHNHHNHNHNHNHNHQRSPRKGGWKSRFTDLPPTSIGSGAGMRYTDLSAPRDTGSLAISTPAVVDPDTPAPADAQGSTDLTRTGSDQSPGNGGKAALPPPKLRVSMLSQHLPATLRFPSSVLHSLLHDSAVLRADVDGVLLWKNVAAGVIAARYIDVLRPHQRARIHTVLSAYFGDIGAGSGARGGGGGPGAVASAAGAPVASASATQSLAAASADAGLNHVSPETLCLTPHPLRLRGNGNHNPRRLLEHPLHVTLSGAHDLSSTLTSLRFGGAFWFCCWLVFVCFSV